MDWPANRRIGFGRVSIDMFIGVHWGDQGTDLIIGYLVEFE